MDAQSSREKASAAIRHSLLTTKQGVHLRRFARPNERKDTWSNTLQRFFNLLYSATRTTKEHGSAGRHPQPLQKIFASV